MYGVEGSRVEGWVECESLTGVDTEDFEAEDFLFELKGEIGVSLGGEIWGLHSQSCLAVCLRRRR